MREEHIPLPHKLVLNDRKQLSVSGVTGVVGFDSETVMLHTTLGTLTVKGTDLQLEKLSLDGGEVGVTGNICAFAYTENRQAGGFWRRLLG